MKKNSLQLTYNPFIQIIKCRSRHKQRIKKWVQHFIMVAGCTEFSYFPRNHQVNVDIVDTVLHAFSERKWSLLYRFTPEGQLLLQDCIEEVICKNKTDCCICMEPILTNHCCSSSTLLSCKHQDLFHSHCLTDWLLYQNPTCPVCRSNVVIK